MARHPFLNLVAALFLIPVLTQSIGAAEAMQKDSLLSRLAGHWVLTGTIEGQNTTHDVDADWALNGYLRLHEVSREKAPDGTPAYEAIIFIARQPQTNRYVCFWLDNSVISGPDSPGVAPAEPDRMAFSFSRGSFLNTMTWHPDTVSWQWLMEGVSKSGQRTAFADLTLVRAK